MISAKSVPNRRKDEKIVLHLRRHWFIFFKIFFGYLLLFLVPPVIYGLFYFVYGVNLWDYARGEAVQAFFKVLILIYYMSMLLFAFTAWTENYLDVWTLTNERILSRDQRGLFNRVVSELELANVQDVTVEQKGIVPTFFGYGDVYIQSAAEVERFVFQQVPDPYNVGKLIQNLDEQIRIRKNIPGRV